MLICMRIELTIQRIIAACVLVEFILIVVLLNNSVTISRSWYSSKSTNTTVKLEVTEGQYKYDRNSPLIFVGGFPRSGTTLMRALLDAHPDVRCGEETHVIPSFLAASSGYVSRTPNFTNILSNRIIEAGLTNDILLEAEAAFLLEIISRHGPPASRLCNKDPFTARYMTHLEQMFPNAKHLFMIRDGRAVVHSISTRNVGIGGFNTTTVSAALSSWNNMVVHMNNECDTIGPAKCLKVYYEQLVLHPRQSLINILAFLNVTWNEAVLHHEDYINKKGGISLSRLEKSTTQVIKPINLESLTAWTSYIPADVRLEMDKLAPILSKLGYNTTFYPPFYGFPDPDVVKKSMLVQQNAVFWKTQEDLILNLSKTDTSNTTAPVVR